MRAAINAGWRRRELWWERLQEQGNSDLETGKRRRACRRFLWAYWIARIGFDRRDPRYATSLANAGFVARERGKQECAEQFYRRASEAWKRVPDTLEAIEMKPRVRSSLFHLRMELRHRDRYQARVRSLLAGLVSETGATLVTLAQNSDVTDRLFTKWRAEKPPVFDDTRRIVSSCLLVATNSNP
jgi:hypothetical protein